jgi:CHASE3 domain sensor protein
VKESEFKILRWAPVVASVMLMVVIVIISVRTVSELRKATNWREHAFKTILDAQTFQDKLVDAQNTVRNYVGKGSSDLLIEYRNDTNIDLKEVGQLADLTSNDPEQEKRLKELTTAVQAVFAYDNKVIGVYARQGQQTAQQAETAPEDGDTTEKAITDLENFTADEEKQVDTSDATEQKDYHRVAHFLVFGSVLVATLLIFANWVAGREMARRRKAETEQRELIEKLKTALAEVKTLSGLIPICGWCKSVRNDSGFWQSVEQYVRARTDANFTHGICPACQEKMKAEIAKAGQAGKL